jgi:hypothetical protein
MPGGKIGLNLIREAIRQGKVGVSDAPEPDGLRIQNMAKDRPESLVRFDKREPPMVGPPVVLQHSRKPRTHLDLTLRR